MSLKRGLTTLVVSDPFIWALGKLEALLEQGKK